MFSLLASIDLLNGKVARLLRGSLEEAVYYSGSAVDFAKRWALEGADALHVVDLNAAFELSTNHSVIEDILRVSSVPVQVAGGVRSLEKAEKLVDIGVARVVVSSLYFNNRSEALTLLDVLGPDRVVVAVDFGDDGFVVTRGWREKTRLTVGEAIEQVLADGFKMLLATDVSRDGTLLGVDTKSLASIPSDLRKHLFVGGGVASEDDCVAVAAMGFGGVVVGKALYEDRVHFRTVRKRILNMGR